MRPLLAALALACALLSASAPAFTVGARLMAAGATDAGAAARQAAATTGGRVLDVQPGSSGGRPVYLVKVLLSDGRVKVVRVEGSPRGEGRH